ncbi:alpha-1,2-fucosyltransferase [Mycobacterium sp. Aquia_213]|uniref:alpha-1,2-fucosyltransferase n=1 Tax=Mycobacterium sp. Aquia_213 TaxID=2991728 RepID=UPI00226F0BD1|nr:alpha-1,2-fucosyltransferase [Mycobacterium sp. Aquia_213]WAC93378.1 alpha-1,2-fucosyltransferase [Mycobacterium sp. Aquia_213]
MISFPELGRMGRIGNQLFQIAATIGLARDHDDRYGFPRWPYEGEFALNGCFYDSLPEGPMYQEPNFHYDRIPYAPNLQLRGFFQSERYFAAHAEYVRTVLTPLHAREIEELEGTASLQVRRGDYVYLQPKHPLVPMSFYEKAMDHLRAQGTRGFLIFSDDLDWCRSQAWPVDATVIPNLAVREQFSMTMACEHHILGNSSFSWWTAWLDRKPDKIVIAPEAWFGADFRDEFPTRDLLPPQWIVL